jgi:hypothetical protein
MCNFCESRNFIIRISITLYLSKAIGFDFSKQVFAVSFFKKDSPQQNSKDILN